MKKECVAMLLAGGQGSRLNILTTNIAKPAIPFGGKYRIIDFTLSNCINSDIDTLGVLTQFQPHELNAYIGSGQPWDLDRLEGGIHILPPYVKEGKAGTWYKGSANAVYQNIGFIDNYDPDYVLVLCTDHIYKMDYTHMIDAHKRAQADCTVSVTEVSLEDATGLGIMNIDSEGMICEFEEKPAHPKSNLASMGMYVFNWQKLRKYLIEDEADKNSKNDFGYNIITKMLAAGERMFAYRFGGYWRDVGTIDALWESNMDMLAASVGINLFDPKWRIYARDANTPPHYIGTDAEVSHSMVTEGCEVYGRVENSLLFNSVRVAKGAVVRYSILMPGAVIEEDALVDYAIVAEGAVIGRGAHVGSQPDLAGLGDWGVSVIASEVEIGPGRVVPCKTFVEK